MYTSEQFKYINHKTISFVIFTDKYSKIRKPNPD